jgi:site-specific DNA recombinase
MKVVGYIRISTQEQASGHGLEYQQRAIEEYCKAQGLTLTAIYSDIASGTKRKRSGLIQVLADLEGVEALVVYHTDRLSRKLIHLLQLIDHVGKENKRILSKSQPEFDVNNPTGRLMFSILGAVSEFELTRITERMVNGRMMVKQKAMLEDGKRLNHGKRPAYGEKKHWEVMNDGSILKLLIPDEEALATIELIRRHRRSGKSYYAIAKWLNEKGLINKFGKRWSSNAVQLMCSN